MNENKLSEYESRLLSSKSQISTMKSIGVFITLMSGLSFLITLVVSIFVAGEGSLQVTLYSMLNGSFIGLLIWVTNFNKLKHIETLNKIIK